MRKSSPVAAAILLLAALPLAAAFGQASISVSAHNFTSTGPNATYQFAGSLCETCHVPHTPAEGSSGPLWNHAVTTATFTLYSSSTLNATPGQPAGVSKLCLSCHDGTVAVDSYGAITGTLTIPNTDDHYIGIDLSNDHPVAFTYNAALATADGALQTPATSSSGKPVVGTSELPLYGAVGSATLECATCHNPHGAGVSLTKFLRHDVVTICTQCHNK